MPDEPDGGDPVCWLHQLCPECGAMPTEQDAEAGPVPCWRCGTMPPVDGAHAT